MHFLADESCDMAVVRALRERGHDVALVRERAAGIKDMAVARIAQEEQRVLLTEDKDFGQLVHALSGVRTGVLLLRFPRAARAQIGPAASSAVDVLGERLKSAFVVVETRAIQSHRIQAIGDSMRYAIVVEKGEGNYGAYVPDLPGCVAVGDTIEETQREIQEAIEFHFEGLRADVLEKRLRAALAQLPQFEGVNSGRSST